MRRERRKSETARSPLLTLKIILSRCWALELLTWRIFDPPTGDPHYSVVGPYLEPFEAGSFLWRGYVAGLLAARNAVVGGELRDHQGTRPICVKLAMKR